MKQLSILLLAFVVCILPASAQKATDILDRTAAAIRDGGTIHARFKVTQFNGTSETSSATGDMWMDAERYKMETPDLSLWYDGTTMWSMMAGSGEANILPPDDENPLGTSPYRFLGVYKKGYKASMKMGSLRGENVYTVTLTAKNKATQPTDIVLDIAQSDYRLLCIRLRQDGDWTRISLLSCKHHTNTPQGFFSFPAADFPEVQIIDLR